MAVKRTSGNHGGSAAGAPASGESAPPPPLMEDHPYWTLEHDIALFGAILNGSAGHKPAGPARHFQMAVNLDHMHKSGLKDATAAAAWDRLEMLYDLETIDARESEVQAGPDDPDDDDADGVEEFALPRREFQAVLNEMKRGGE